jgi:hypothetical protein
MTLFEVTRRKSAEAFRNKVMIIERAPKMQAFFRQHESFVEVTPSSANVREKAAHTRRKRCLPKRSRLRQALAVIVFGYLWIWLILLCGCAQVEEGAGYAAPVPYGAIRL